MTIKIKKTYNSNFDLLDATSKTGLFEGKAKAFMKIVKSSDEVGTTFQSENWENVVSGIEGLCDCEFEVDIDTDELIVDELGNIYFLIID